MTGQAKASNILCSGFSRAVQRLIVPSALLVPDIHHPQTVRELAVEVIERGCPSIAVPFAAQASGIA